MHDRLSAMLRFFLVFILDFLELSTKHKRYGGVRRSRNIPDQTGWDWKNAASALWDATARWHRLKLISRARQDLRREARRGHGAATVTVRIVIAERTTPHCAGLTRMLCNSRVGSWARANLQRLLALARACVKPHSYPSETTQWQRATCRLMIFTHFKSWDPTCEDRRDSKYPQSSTVRRHFWAWQGLMVWVGVQGKLTPTLGSW